MSLTQAATMVHCNLARCEFDTLKVKPFCLLIARGTNVTWMMFTQIGPRLLLLEVVTVCLVIPLHFHTELLSG